MLPAPLLSPPMPWLRIEAGRRLDRQFILRGHSGPRVKAESQAQQSQGHAVSYQEQPQPHEQHKQCILGPELCGSRPRWVEMSLLPSQTLTSSLTLVPDEKSLLWQGGVCRPAGREVSSSARAIPSLPIHCLPACPPARLPVHLPGCCPTYLWSKSKARKLLSSSSSSKAGPTMAKMTQTVIPSAPSPRALSRSRGQLGSQHDICAHTALPGPSPAPRTLAGTRGASARALGLRKQSWVMEGSGGDGKS